MKASRWDRLMGSVSALAIATFACLLLAGCFTFTRDTNNIVMYQDALKNWRVDVYFRRAATNDVVDLLHYDINGGNGRKTLALMDDYKTSQGFRNALEGTLMVMSDVSYFFDQAQVHDFNESADQTHNNTKCITMYRNWLSLEDRHNWTERNAGGACDIGVHF